MAISSTTRAPRTHYTSVYCRPVLWSALLGLVAIQQQQQSQTNLRPPVVVVEAFRPIARPIRRATFGSVNTQQRPCSILYSSVGDDNRKPPSDDGDGDGDFYDGLEDFLDPNKKESKDLQRAREYMSETSLPISFDEDDLSTGNLNGETVINQDDDEEEDDDDGEKEGMDEEDVRSIEEEMVASAMASSSSSELSYKGSSPAATSSLFSAQQGGEITPAILAKNPYMNVVSRLSPSELISKFTATANPRVQEAVRSTILGLIGSLPKMAFETTTITTGQRLASLMFQLQMTGYMFKNAEYRLSLSQSLGMSISPQSSSYLLPGVEEVESEEDEPKLNGKVAGKIKIKLGGIMDGLSDTINKAETEAAESTKSEKESAHSDDESSSSTSSKGLEMEVDAQAYLSELRTEVSQLREELSKTREKKDEAIHNDLLLYIRTLPAKELKALTDTMTPDVLVCMKGLVSAVLAGIGEGEIAAETVTEQSGEAMAQLCMWQLAMGYNLRELEVREAMKKNLNSLLGSDDEDGGVDLSEPGVME